MDTLKNLLNHERYQSIAVLLIIGFLLWFYGCDSKCNSLTRPNTQVTRSELTLEIQSLQGLADLRYADLDRQDAFRTAVIEQALIVGQTGTFNPYGVIAMLAGTIGIGATIDNVRKRTEIKKLSNGK
ncbi:hypothetical protein ES703_78504 [subsurface metagenome]